MEFVHRPEGILETIAAIATPPGEGGVAVIRISGKDAVEIAARVYSGPINSYVSHTAHVGKILDISGNAIDEVLILVMRAPRSYTGEDTVEVHCHGGSFISRRVLERILEAGARAAGPGEFTLRAFLNGKIDLVQAEAVQQLIGAKNALAMQSAEKQLEGRLSSKISHYQQELLSIAAILEAWVDFPEEDLEFATMEEVIAQLVHIEKEMQTLCDSFYEGSRIHQGITLCLAGAPNAGKSCLMNLLLGKERAIVTDIPGTTRDLLEEDLHLGSLHFRLIDTAGIRATEEVIEKEGIRRSIQAMQDADLILLVVDGSVPISAEAAHVIASTSVEKTLFIRNKMDLVESSPVVFSGEQVVDISAKTQIGIDALKRKIDQMIWKKGPPAKDEIVITSARHHQSLMQAINSLRQLIEHLETGISPEFISLDMRAVLSDLGAIVGLNITEDILSAIFSKFCIGK